MKISHSENNSLSRIYQNQSVRESEVASRRSKSESAPTPPTDSLDLSSTAKLLQLAKKTIDDRSGTSAQRVQQLKEQVQLGTYRVPEAELANKLLLSGHV